MSESPKQIDQLVMVVHGVGDPDPGGTLSKLARSLASESQPLTETQQVLWLGEHSEKENVVQTFPSHVRDLEFTDAKVKLAEVFWGDLSRVRHGIIGVITGLFEILFGLRYVSYVAADQKGSACQSLKRLGDLATRIIHGPVLAVCFMLAILTVAVAGTEVMWKDSCKARLWNGILVSSCSAMAVAIAAIGFRLTSNRVIRRFWFWVQVSALFVGILVGIELFVHRCLPNFRLPDAMSGILWYCQILVTMLGCLWFAETCLILASACVWLAAARDRQTYNPALNVAFLVPAAIVGFWGLALPIAWLAAAKSLQRFAELESFEDLFHSAVPMMGVQVVMASSMLMVSSVVVFHFYRWRKAHADFEPGQRIGRPPRLIVAPIIQLALATCAMVGVVLVSFLGLMSVMGQDYTTSMVGNFMAEGNKYAFGFLLPTGFLTFMILPHIQPVLDIVLDVVNHFNFRDTQIVDVLNDEDEFDIKETTFDSGRLYFYRRDQIHVRFKTLLAHFRDQLENRPALTVVSHSQGTMVAIEALNDPDLIWLRNQFSSITLVTMGSPFTHLYQHYFRHFYPDLTDAHWRDLINQVDRWINIHRIDDFVGTTIDFPTNKLVPTAAHPNGAYSNHAVGPRGHMNYWADEQVLTILRRELMGVESDDELDDFAFRQSAA